MYASRKKDFENPFRKITYRNEEEMHAALGTVDQDRFVQQIRGETEEFLQKIRTLEERLISQ